MKALSAVMDRETFACSIAALADTFALYAAADALWWALNAAAVSV